MKKIYIYIVWAAVAVALLAVSCVRELDIPRPVSGGDNAVIRITPFCEEPSTKADHARDTVSAVEDPYHENTITDYYWFMYSDQEGTNLVLSGYHSSASDTVISISNTFPIANNAYGYVYVVANLPAEYEYVAPTNNNPAGIKRVVGETETFYPGTFASLKTIEFGKDMPTTYTNSSEFYEYTSATTGVPKPEKFVMRTETLERFQFKANENIEVTAELTRVAAKIVLDLYVAQKVEQNNTKPDGSLEYVRSWKADMSHLQIYMLWGSTHGNLAGDPISYSTDHSSWFYSASPRYAMYTDPDGEHPDGGWFNGTSVVGSVPADRYEEVQYPVASSVLDYVYVVDESAGDEGWIWKDDVAQKDKIDAHRGDYYYGDWAYILDDQNNKQIVLDEDNVQVCQWVSRTVEGAYYHILSLPLYSMPISWNVNDAHAPFIKVIVPWQGYDKNNDTEPQPPYSSTKEFYYKILVPELTQLDANNCYHIKLDLSVLGSESDEVPVQISGQYHVVDWNETEEMGGNQSAGRYLDCATLFEFYSKDEMNIPIRSSHDIEVLNVTAKYQDYSGDEVATVNLPTSTYSVSAVGNSRVTINHTLVNVLSNMNNYDVSQITYTFTIQHKGEGGSAYQKDITVIQYPSIYIEADPNSGASEKHVLTATRRSNGYGSTTETVRRYSTQTNSNGQYSIAWSTSTSDSYNTGGPGGTTYYLDNFVCGYTFVNTIYHTTTSTQSSGYTTYTYTYTGYHNYSPTVTGPNDWTITGGLIHSNNTNPNMYVITTKVLSNEDQVIGDPRTNAESAIADYEGWVTAPGYEGSTGRKLQAYKQAESSDRTLNMIAPKIRTASSFGATKNFSFEEASLRCAGYQEDGLPAGRWRLPTAAEIAYLVNLSARHFLPRLFGAETGTTNYWSANGYVTVDNENNTVETHTGTDAFDGTNFIRCVYDEWYWEGQRLAPADRHTFTWGDEIN